jgi:hypothetical protein
MRANHYSGKEWLGWVSRFGRNTGASSLRVFLQFLVLPHIMIFIALSTQVFIIIFDAVIF